MATLSEAISSCPLAPPFHLLLFPPQCQTLLHFPHPLLTPQSLTLLPCPHLVLTLHSLHLLPLPLSLSRPLMQKRTRRTKRRRSMPQLHLPQLPTLRRRMMPLPWLLSISPAISDAPSVTPVPAHPAPSPAHLIPVFGEDPECSVCRFKVFTNMTCMNECMSGDEVDPDTVSWSWSIGDPASLSDITPPDQLGTKKYRKSCRITAGRDCSEEISLIYNTCK